MAGVFDAAFPSSVFDAAFPDAIVGPIVPFDPVPRLIGIGRYILYIAEAQDFPMPTIGDYSSRNIRLVVEVNQSVDDLAVYQEADLDKTDEDITFNLAPITGSTGLLNWSIRDAITNENLESGQFEVKYAATVT